MANDLTKFTAEVILGSNANTRDLNPNFELTMDSRNLSLGIQQGLTPRYGLSPVPNHNHNENPPAGGSAGPAGLERSETSGVVYTTRYKVYACYPLRFGKCSTSATDLNTKETFFLWVIGKFYTDSGTAEQMICLDFVVGGSYTAAAPPVPTKYYPDSDIASTLHQDTISYLAANADRIASTKLLNFIVSTKTSPYDTSLAQKTKINTSALSNFISTAAFSVTGTDVPSVFTVAFRNVATMAVGTVNHPQEATYVSSDFTKTVTTQKAGILSSWNTRKFGNVTRNVIFYDCSTSSGLEIGYNYIIPDVTTVYLSGLDNKLTKNIDITALGTAGSVEARLDAKPPGYTDCVLQVLKDELNMVNSSYAAVLAATGNGALMCIVQDWLRDTAGTVEQFYNPCLDPLAPKIYDTIEQNSATASHYAEDTIPTKTSFSNFPNFVTGSALGKNTAEARDGAHHVTLGEANSGVLRKNTVYEISYSIFDKRYNRETNIGLPARIQTGNDDFVSLSLYRDSETTPPTLDQRVPITQTFLPIYDTIFAYSGSVTLLLPFNYIQFRFYYRELGSFEWLPALFIDAVQYFYYPNNDVVWACQGPIAALPGGQPGGFNDYSPLPQDNYIDVKIYQGRIFWCSAQAIYFSYRNNVFAYAARNSIACPSGSFRGMLAHAYPGQAEQSSRLIIFGSEAIYRASFTGSLVQNPVQVSADVVGTFPLDGSDFTVDYWTSYTAFSWRSAVVAEGILYYWGPKGIFSDGGVNLPQRISGPLEPDIFSLVDPARVDGVHASYSSQTKEVIWVFDRVSETSSSTLTYNVQTGQFLLGGFEFKVDGGQEIDISGTETERATNGLRHMVFARNSTSADLQRAYYFDLRNRSGDFYPSGEFMVKTVGALASHQLTITLAAGFNTTSFNTISVGDEICFNQTADYSMQPTAVDFIGTVVSINLGSSQIVVNVPSDILTYYAGTLTQAVFFPVYLESVNSFTYLLDSRFWLPGGIDFYGFWEYLYLLFKIDIPPSINPRVLTLGYRTPVSAGLVYNDLTLVDNSVGNCQIYTSLKNVDRSHDGQGVKLTLGGDHIGSQWVLQFLQAYVQRFKDVYHLKEFEG